MRRGAGSRRLSATHAAQTEGPIEAHSEDYSSPYGDHIGRCGLCYRYHIALHCRHKNPAAWEAYKRHVRQGRIYTPIGRNYVIFCRQTLDHKGEGVPFKQEPVRPRTLLDDLLLVAPRGA